MKHDIRLAAPDDLAAVEAIVQNAYSHYVKRIGRKPGPMLDDYRSLILSSRVYVAETQGTICGVLVLIPQDDGKHPVIPS